jgi:hypothetical protein
LPVAGKKLAEVQTRAQYFSRMIEIQRRSPALVALDIRYHPKAPSLLSHVYFALSEAYKAIFLNEGKGTDPTKQAAFTCATISVVKPLHSPTDQIDREEYIYMNQMFAMRCACGIVDHPFHSRSWHDRRRFYKQLQKLDLPVVNPIIDEAVDNNGDITTEWKIKLSNDDEYKLTSLVNQFVVLKDLKIIKS